MDIIEFPNEIAVLASSGDKVPLHMVVYWPERIIIVET